MSVQAEEIVILKRFFPASSIVVANSEQCTIVIAKTGFKTIRVTAQFLDTYPESALVLKITSKTMTTGTCARLVKLGEQEASKHLGSKQLMPVMQYLRDLMFENMFVFCMEELKAVRQIFKEKGTLKMNEKTGIIKAKLKKDKYHVSLEITVPNEYPDKLEFHIVKSNFPPTALRVFTSQTLEIIRRCTVGYSADQALMGSNPIQMPAKVARAKVEYKITSDHLLGLKNDMKFLQKAKDLKAINGAKKFGDHSKFANSGTERRHARRLLNKLATIEAKKEDAVMAKTEEMAKMEVAASILKPASTAQSSLAAALKFFVESFVVRLPEEKCQVCRKRILPSDPMKAKKLLEGDEENPLRPERVYCGHWFHHKCLDKFIREPPFGIACPSCSERVYHPKWPSDIKKLEKQWAKQQAKKRELSEVSEFLDLDEEFVRDENEEVTIGFGDIC
eukprot:TRINITY_DN486_c0_g1_i1.p1 TRINITY_DN486_c0_g1~~TRINITY_DN486_c0_g1_i1.p1  ORF type:complete len:448 (+),score=141.24 TRINITY_DN486_c0_g1_i1:61-1404(+)